jgi:sensor histidine kinase YesM
MKIDKWPSWWRRIFVCSLLSALIVPIIGSGMEVWTWSNFIQTYVMSFFYAICIGSILGPTAEPLWKITSRTRIVVARWIMRAAWVVLGAALGCLLAGLAIWPIIGRNYAYWRSFRNSYGIAIVLSAFATGFMMIYHRFRFQLEASQLQLKEKEVEREKALKLATEATLSSLESRMHPHFLFNTINSISSLIHEDPERAEKMLSQMADLLRFSLDSASAGLVPLSRELKIVRDYLEIEKARFESRLRYDIHVPAGLEDLPFPPLSLQTVVENSVKYAVSVTRNGADILIYAHLESAQLILMVEDNGPVFQLLTCPPAMDSAA